MHPSQRVVLYDKAWPLWFAQISARLAPALPDGFTVEHVGSTAVPGLTGKPVIDVDVVAPGPAAVASGIAALVQAGYRHRGDLGIPGREAFADTGSELPYHHLYLVVRGSAPHRDHVDLRDYLRRRPDECARYAAEKVRLAEHLSGDRARYVAGKGWLVAEMLASARLEFRS